MEKKELLEREKSNHAMENKRLDIKSMILENVTKYDKIKRKEKVRKINAPDYHKFNIVKSKKKLPEVLTSLYVLKSADDVSSYIEEQENENAYSDKAKKYKKSSIRLTTRKFSIEEDEVIRRAIEREVLGDKIDFPMLAVKLTRSYRSVQQRVGILKTSNGVRSPRPYSLIEDLKIVDGVVENLSGKTLEEINLYRNGVAAQIESSLGRTGSLTVLSRWTQKLLPWILQHYSGTLNLEIRRMLTNYLEVNFDSIESIDWGLVAAKPDFVGHTQGSLRKIFTYVCSKTKAKFNLEFRELTLRHIADFANEAYGENKKKIPSTILKRQRQVIEYFELSIKKKGITKFL